MDKAAKLCDFGRLIRVPGAGLDDYRDTDGPAATIGAVDHDGGRRRRRSGTSSGGDVRRGASSKRDDRSKDDVTFETQQHVVFGVFAAMLVGITLLQKVGYVPNPATVIPLILPIAYAALGVGILFARPIFRPERTILYLAVVFVSGLSNILFSRAYSLNSMALYGILYLPFLVSFETSRATYRRCLDLFSTVMLVFAVIVWLQHAVQLTIGWRYWPNLDTLLPVNMLIPQFVYLQPIEWGLNLMKPSGICFLEVSMLSQFITFALVMELLYLQRTWRAVFFGATLFATFAGTGLLLLAVSLPIVLTRSKNTRTFTIVLATAFIALFVALQLHWFDLVAHRFGEFQESGSSANSRFIAPLDRVRRALLDDSAVYSGVGAGQIETGLNVFWWPIVKTTVEYGLIAGLLFYAFFLHAMFDRAPSRPMAFVIILWFSFESTLLTPLNPLGCVMLSTMFCMRDERRPRRRSSGEGKTGRADRGADAGGAAALTNG